jgi:uncharacterized protein DUF935
MAQEFPYGAPPNGARDPFAPPRDPLRGVAPRSVFRTVRDAPVGVVPDWTIGMVRAALRDHQFGAFAQSALLVESVLADDRVHATLGAVSSALFGRPVKHFAATGPGIDAGRAEAARAAWVEVWDDLANCGAFDTMLRWRKLLGFSVAEILWRTDVEPWRPVLKFFHPLYLYYRLDLRAYVAITLDGSEVVEPGAGKWLLHAPFGQYRGWQLGAIRPVAPLWLTRTYALRDWARFSEVHGLPLMKAKVPVGGDEGEKERFTAAVTGLGQESVVMLPQGIDATQNYDLELLEAKDRSWEAFRGLIDQCDMSIVLALMHQNLMTEMTEGSNAAARQHANVREEEIRFCERTFMHDLYDQVARPWAAFNFGDPNLAPTSRYDLDVPEDQTARADILVKIGTAVDLLTRSGVKIDVASVAASMGLTLSVKESAISKLVLAPTDVAKVVTVDEARAAQGLPGIGDERGGKTISEAEAAAAPPPAPPVAPPPEEMPE